MIKTTVMPKETMAELLLFLAEHEKFNSVVEKLGGGMTVEEVRASLRELSRELACEAAMEKNRDVTEVKREIRLTSKTKEVISCLSDREENRLFAAFGFCGK